ncbi:MAG: sigma-70 family RNA polymerase sigma factor [Planctomycetaceae bacterium]|nr:sigma-70 family RNA polymerase sigma factor [Planctomycetaceae bacterium]
MNQQGNTTQLQALLDLASEGDDEAYGQLVSQASERLLKLTRKMIQGFPRLRRWEATDDVFQTAAMRLYRSLSEVKPESVRDFFGLAATQIRRTLIDLARHHYGPEGHGAKHHTDGDGQAADDGVLKQQSGQNLKPESLDAWVRFHEAVEQLPKHEQEVFQLLWYAGLQQSEAATLLGVSVPTVQRRWYQAQHYLRRAADGNSPVSEELE